MPTYYRPNASESDHLRRQCDCRTAVAAYAARTRAIAHRVAEFDRKYFPIVVQKCCLRIRLAKPRHPM